MFLRRTAAVSLSGYLFFGSSVDIGSKAVQVGCVGAVVGNCSPQGSALLDRMHASA